MEDKKKAIKEAAYHIFLQKGYKATSVSEIAKKAGVAVGSFYNYYDSKEAIFLDVYIDENKRVRQKVMEMIDWEGQLVTIIKALFSENRSFISKNKILLEWQNPAIASYVRAYYQSEEGQQNNPFQDYLLDFFTERLKKEGYSPKEIQDILGVYNLFYYLDTHLSEKDFPNLTDTLEVLAITFVKGIESK